MNVKKEVIASIKSRLDGEQRKIDAQLRRNAYEMNQLAEKSTILKREKAELAKLIKSMD